jgi:UDP-GlcNAc:undecaprenyl-phosphate/decaprenyl-phosphate GlcNAc-1-phosphate transferase
VAVRRTLERRPVTQGGTDHSSHRLVYYGLSEQQAVAALTLLAALLGLTALAYIVLANARITAAGVLVSFVVLVQFASFLADLQERSRREDPGPPPPLWRAFLSNPRRLVEVLVDFTIICVCFLASYFLVVEGGGTNTQRALFLATLPILLGVRYVLFVLFGIYRRIWRFASARDLFAIGLAVALSVPLTIGIVRAIRPLEDFPLQIFVLDALLCMTVVAGSRLALRTLPGLSAGRTAQRRVLIAGAGRSGRALARELGETPDTRVVGFVDDNHTLRRRRIHGVTVHGRLDDVPRLLGELQVDEVLVTVPGAASDRLEALVASCEDAEVECRFVVREIAPPPSRVEVPAE